MHLKLKGSAFEQCLHVLTPGSSIWVYPRIICSLLGCLMDKMMAVMHSLCQCASRYIQLTEPTAAVAYVKTAIPAVLILADNCPHH